MISNDTLRARSLRTSRAGRHSSVKSSMDGCAVQMEEVREICERVKLLTGKDTTWEIEEMVKNIDVEN